MQVWYLEKLLNGSVNERKTTCFSSMSYLPIVEIVYHVPVHHSLSKEKVDFYINFLDKVLKEYRFTHSFSLDNKLVSFTLKTEPSCRAKILLYLTAFRYIDEYCGYLDFFFRFQNEPTEKLFEIFQGLHWLYFNYEKKLNFPLMSGPGHSLISNYGTGTCKTKAVKLKDFQVNFKSEQNTVYNFFETDRNGEEFTNLMSSLLAQKS